MILKGKKAIITGGSRGIGKAITDLFLKEGAKVCIVTRGAEGKNSSFLNERADVSETADVKKVFAALNKLWGGQIDILVNAAGIYGPKGLLEEVDEKEWMETILINLMGTVYMTKEVLPFMKKNKSGVIINFSGGGEGAFPHFSAYAASKGGVVRFTETVAEEVKDFGIRMNAVAPGAVNTKLLEEVLEAGPERVGKDFYERSKKQKEDGGVSPQKAAQLCLFLASEKSKGISGKVLSAVWDDFDNLPEHISEIMNSDIYTFRRIKPIDRGYGWK